MAQPDASGRTIAPNLRLRALREARNESRREFARALRRLAESMGENLACDERRVARWERGEVKWPRSAYRRVLTALLGVPIEQLGFDPPDRVAEAIADSPGALASPPSRPDGAAWPPDRRSPRQTARGQLVDTAHSDSAFGAPEAHTLRAAQGMHTVGLARPANRDAAEGGSAGGGEEGAPIAASGDSGSAPPPPPPPPPRHEPETVFGPVLDLSPGTLESLESAALELCRAYGHEPVREVIALAQKRLALVTRLLQEGMRPVERRRLLVVCGWFSAVLGCAFFDTGQRRRAETQRLAVRDLGTEAGHSELAAWAHEMSTWFALAEGRFRDALVAAQAGEVSVGDSAVAARLALHEAKAAARLRDRRQAEDALERARGIGDRLPWPFDELNHFAMDEATLAAHAATAYLWIGDDTAAEDCAWQVLVHQLKPEGKTRHPMRIAEIRCTLGILAARRHDLEQAVYFGTLALGANRVSIPTMLMRAMELEAVLTTGFPGAKPAREYVDKLQAVRRQWQHSE